MKTRMRRRFPILLSLSIVVLVLTAQVPAQPSDLERRVAQLEQRVQTLEGVIASMRVQATGDRSALYALVRLGMTPREVVALLGEPRERMTFIWYYPEATSGGKYFYVEFKNGVVYRTSYLW